MFERIIDVTTPSGLHARPAGLVTELVSAVPFEVEIGRPGEEFVDAESILSIMGLGVTPGEQVALRCQTDAENPDAVEFIHSITEILTQND